MGEPNGPVLISKSPVDYYAKPGLHSRNVTRRVGGVTRTFRNLKRLQVILMFLGVCALGYYAYTLCDQVIYQNYENWAFDQKIAGRSYVDFADYLRERTPFGFLAGTNRANGHAVPIPTTSSQLTSPSDESLPVQGSVLGRIAVPRLKLSAIVREGVDAKTLSIAVGHVPSTALPGRDGNFAIAAHRDTLFRALKDIQKDDLVTFEAPDRQYSYKVVATKIVRPSDVSVLSADGGGLVSAQDIGGSGQPKLLTMITCYPFYFVGSAPKRFIVEANLVSDSSRAQTRLANAQTLATPVSDNPALIKPEVSPPALSTPKTVNRTSLAKPRPQRSFSASVRPSRKHSPKPATSHNQPRNGLWHKVFHKE